MKKRLLITGGSGFIGKNLVQGRLKDTFQLLTPSHRDLDLDDEFAVKTYLEKEDVFGIVHTAVKPAHRAAEDVSQVLTANLRYFYSLLRCEHLYEKLVVLGSGSVYDHRYYRPGLREEDFDTSVPRDDLGLFKYAINQSIQPEGKVFDLRLFGVYGPYEDYRIRFPSNMICKALLGLPMTMNQDRIFDYLHVDDLAPVLEWILTGNPLARAYNVTSGNPVSLYQLAVKIRALAASSSEIVVRNEGLGKEYSGRNSRLTAECPNLEFRSLENGMSELIGWYSEMLPTLDPNIFKTDY